MAQLESHHDEFTKRGAALIVIAAQKIDGLFHAKDYVSEHAHSFPLLFDETRKITRAYGVYHALGKDAFNIAHPATFIAGPEGKICWIALSTVQTERPTVNDILSAIGSCDKY
jgi:peroxiredoxin